MCNNTLIKKGKYKNSIASYNFSDFIINLSINDCCFNCMDFAWFPIKNEIKKM